MQLASLPPPILPLATALFCIEVKEDLPCLGGQLILFHLVDTVRIQSQLHVQELPSELRCLQRRGMLPPQLISIPRDISMPTCAIHIPHAAIEGSPSAVGMHRLTLQRNRVHDVGE